MKLMKTDKEQQHKLNLVFPKQCVKFKVSLLPSPCVTGLSNLTGATGQWSTTDTHPEVTQRSKVSLFILLLAF